MGLLVAVVLPSCTILCTRTERKQRAHWLSSCSAVGDIISIVSLIRSIAIALNESRGSVKDFRDVYHELESLSSLLDACARQVEDSSDDDSKDKVFKEIGKCFVVISDELASMAPYASLSPIRSSNNGIKERAERMGLKIRWRALRQSEAQATRVKLQQCRTQLMLALNL